MAESEYVAKLKELGFEQLDSEAIRERAKDIRFEVREGKAEPAEPQPSYVRRLPIPDDQPLVVWFETSPGMGYTFAVDETGQSWRKEGRLVDLTLYGFVDPFRRVSIQ